MFANPNFLSLLTGSETWYADGIFKVVPEYFFQVYTIQAERDGFVYPCEYALLPDKLVLLTIDFSLTPRNTTTIRPSTIMTDFEKAAINAFEDKFVAVIYGRFFPLPNVYGKYSQKG